MKKTFLLFSALGLFLASCGGGNKETATEATDAKDAAKATETSATYAVATDASTVQWHGYKTFSDGAHTGVVAIKEGSLSSENGNLIAGEFVIDLTTIDETSENGYEEKLIGHLKGSDFFSVDSFPTAKFVITEVKAAEDMGDTTHLISGNLTIKGITNNITIPAIVNISEGGVTAKSHFTIDRSQWNVQYGSTSFFDVKKDDIIDNNITFDVSLTANKQENAEAHADASGDEHSTH